MPAFDYTALDTAGRKKRGVLEADSPRLVRQLLRERQLIPLDVNETRQKQNDRNLFSRNSMRGADLALVTRQLATLIQAGLSVEESLSATAQQTEKSSVERIILAVRSKVREGHSLADSLAQFPRAFPTLYIATIAAGEQSGHLDAVLNRLADYIEEQQSFQQKIQLAMIYPIMLVVMSVLIVTGLMVYVVPDIVETLITSGQELPVATKVLISISSFLENHGLWLLLCLLLLAIAIKQLLNRPAIKLRWHKRLLHLPLVKRISRGGNAARYISTLAILTNSGIPLVEGMRISTAVVTNTFLRQRLTAANQQVKEGISLNRTLTQCGYFPPMIVHLVASGETSGELGPLLQKAGKAQETELQRLVSAMVALLEPITLVLMGLIVMSIVFAVLLPILNLNQIVH